MRLRAVLLVSLTLAGGLALPSAQAGTAISRTAVVVTRTAAGPTSFVLGLGASYKSGSRPALFASFGGRLNAGRFDNLLVGRVGAVARDHSALVVRPSGTDPVTCASVGRECPDSGVVSTATIYSDDGEATAPNRWFGIIEGNNTEFTFSGRGWKVKRVPLTYRFAAEGSGSPTVVQFGARGASAMDGSLSLPGGKQGSIAVATAACSNGHIPPLNTGVAQVTLSGAGNTKSISCPSQFPPFAAAAASTTATWTWSGLSAGDDTQLACRLFVLDLRKGL